MRSFKKYDFKIKKNLNDRPHFGLLFPLESILKIVIYIYFIFNDNQKEATSIFITYNRYPTPRFNETLSFRGHL